MKTDRIKEIQNETAYPDSECKQQSENWKDCPKCGLEMTYGKLITNEWYCWNCNHKGNS